VVPVAVDAGLIRLGHGQHVTRGSLLVAGASPCPAGWRTRTPGPSPGGAPVVAGLASYGSPGDSDEGERVRTFS
jgi:hypothetical protein